MPAVLSEHVQWLVTNRGAALLEVVRAMRGGGGDISVEGVLDSMVAADPSPGQHAVPWLCETLIAGGYLWEDLAGGAGGKVGETLRLFAQHRAGLPRGQRNLEDHATLAGVYGALAPLLGSPDSEAIATPGGRAARRAQRLAAYTDSIIVHESRDMLVAVPTTQAASCWWGRGTRWCTAADEHNMFEDYNTHAPLIVVVLRGAEQGGDSTLSQPCKLQLHIDPDGTINFMDASDARVRSQLVKAHWRELEPLMTWALEANGGMASYFPIDMWRGRVAELLVATKSTYLGQLPHEARTYSVCTASVSAHGMTLRDVPPDMRDDAMCRVAVDSNGLALQYVPRELLDAEMCLAAVQSNGTAMGFVPRHLRSLQVQLAAVGQSGASLCQLEEPIDFEVRLAAVANDSATLMIALKARLDDAEKAALYAAAVNHHGGSLQNVPRELRTPELCLSAVSTTPSAIKLLSMDQITAEMLEVVAKSGQGMRTIPVRLLTPQLCMMALEADGSVAQFIPDELFDADMAEMCLGQRGKWLKFVPRRLQTAALCAQAVASEPYAVLDVIPALLTHELIATAVKGSGDLIYHLGEHDLPESIYIESIKQDANNIGYVPSSKLTAELYTLAISMKPFILNHVPKKFMSLEFCKKVCLRNNELLNVIPDAYREQVLEAISQSPPALPQPRPPTPPRRWQPELALAGLAQCLDRAALARRINPGPAGMLDAVEPRGPVEAGSAQGSMI